MDRRNGQQGATLRQVSGEGIKKRRRHTRSILKEGVEAALRADLDVLEKCKPKTALGGIVRGMVLEAAKCKATPLRQLLSLIDWEPPASENESAVADEPAWDWSPEGEWTTMPQAENEEGPKTAEANETDEKDEDPNHPARLELKRRLTRLVEAGQHEHAQRIMDAIRANLHGGPAPPPPS